MAADSPDAPGLSDALIALVGDARRPGMLVLLFTKGPMTATEIGKRYDLQPNATRHHLNLMKAHGWVEVEELRPVGGAHELIWRATPGIDWPAFLEQLNALPEQLKPTE